MVVAAETKQMSLSEVVLMQMTILGVEWKCLHHQRNAKLLTQMTKNVGG